MVTAPADGAYVNDTTPTVAYTGATPLTTVTLKVDDVPVATGVGDTGGAGIITPAAPVARTPPSGSSLPKAAISGGKVKLTLGAAPKAAKSIRVYRADGKGAYKLVKTLAPKSRTFTDAKVKPGHSYKYKTVGVNAQGQQSKASGSATAKTRKT